MSNCIHIVFQFWFHDFHFSAYRDIDSLKALFQSGILEKFQKAKTETRSRSGPNNSQASRSTQDDDPLRIPPRHPPARPVYADPEWGQRSDPFSAGGIGVGDLDPLRAGSHGGGMIVDPFSGPGRRLGGRGGGAGGFHPDAGLPQGLPR